MAKTASPVVRVVALAASITAAALPARAQAPTADDTTAVLASVAAALRGGDTPADSGAAPATVGVWHIASGDTLTARLASAMRYAAVPVPDGAVCPFDAPEGAVTASVTAATLRFVGADTAMVMISSSCLRTRPSAVGTRFAQGDGFRVVRDRGAWKIESRWFFIT